MAPPPLPQKGWSWNQSRKAWIPPPALPNFRLNGLPPALPEEHGGVVAQQYAYRSDRLTPLEDREDGLQYTVPADTWIRVFSTWLSRVKFSWKSVGGGPPSVPTKDPQQRLGYLTIEFRDLSVIQYSAPLPHRAFDDLVGSSSKGYFLHHGSWNLINADYITISAAKRKVSAKMTARYEPGANRKNVSFARPKGGVRPPKLPKSFRAGGI